MWKGIPFLESSDVKLWTKFPNVIIKKHLLLGIDQTTMLFLKLELKSVNGHEKLMGSVLQNHLKYISL